METDEPSQVLSNLLKHLSDKDDLLFDEEKNSFSVRFENGPQIQIDLLNPQTLTLTAACGDLGSLADPDLVVPISEGVYPAFRSTGLALGMAPEVGVFTLSLSWCVQQANTHFAAFFEDLKALSACTTSLSSHLENNKASSFDRFSSLDLWRSREEKASPDVIGEVCDAFLNLQYSSDQIDRGETSCEITLTPDLPKLKLEQAGSNLFLSVSFPRWPEATPCQAARRILASNFSFLDSNGEIVATAPDSTDLVLMRRYSLSAPFNVDDLMNFSAQFFNNALLRLRGPETESPAPDMHPRIFA